MSEWRELVMGELVASGLAEIRTGPFGTQLRASDYTAEGVPVINVRNLGFGSVRRASLERVDVKVQKRLAGHLLEHGDIVFGRKGAVDRHVLVSSKESGWMQGSDCIRLRLLPGAPVGPRFLSKALVTPEHRSWMEAQCSHGATMASLNQEIVSRISLRVPPSSIQRRVVAVLAAFDELIEINERRIELLEDLARSLYREWFVRFRFPGHECAAFVESKLGSIPEGWDACPLFDIADVGFGYSFKSARFSDAGPYPVVRIRDVLDGVTATFTDETADPRYAVYDGDVLVGMDGEFHLNQWSGGEAWLNQRVARLRPITGLSPRHLMLATAAPIRAWNDSIVGTTVAHLGKRHLETIQILVPPGGLLQKVTTAFDALAGEQLLLVSQNRRLAATRDLLLPRLVTGRLDISDIDLGDLLPEEIA